MDAELASKLAKIIRENRLAALGTLHNGSPFVSMVLVAPGPDFCSFYIHISRLAQHTRDIAADNRVSLLLVEKDEGGIDPQQLARVTLVGRAFEVTSGDTDAPEARNLYLERYPASAPYFTFPDFHLHRITIESGRFVAGFAQTLSLKPEHLRKASQI